jgi:hypothetical protein
MGWILDHHIAGSGGGLNGVGSAAVGDIDWMTSSPNLKLKSARQPLSAKHGPPVPGGVVHGVVHLVSQGHGLGLQVLPLRCGKCSRRRLNRQVPHPLKHFRDLFKAAVGGLQEADAVIGISHRHFQPSSNCTHRLDHGHARRVIGGLVDADAGGQLLHSLVHQATVLLERVRRNH